jgi:hypothetical protein
VPRREHCVAGLLAAVFTCVPAAALAQWNKHAELGMVHDSNFSRGQREGDIVADFALQARGSLARTISVDAAADVTLAAEARTQQQARFNGASFASLGGAGEYRRKLGLGLTAPWIQAAASAAREDAGADLRDATRYDATLSLGRRFDERFEASLGTAYDRRVQTKDVGTVAGVSGKPFSLQGRTWFARGSYAVAHDVLFFATASARRGDVEASTHRFGQIFTASSAIAPDPAIGPDYIAYRLSGARTTALTGGISWEIGPGALDVAFTASDTAAGAGLEYRGTVVTLSYGIRR